MLWHECCFLWIWRQHRLPEGPFLQILGLSLHHPLHPDRKKVHRGVTLWSGPWASTVNTSFFPRNSFPPPFSVPKSP